MPPLKDLTGQRFGRLIVVERDTSRNGVYWLCRCDCGKTVSVRAYNLTSSSTKSCGCLNNELIHRKQRNAVDLTGQMHGDLEAIRYLYSNKHGTVWLCKCHACGNLCKISAAEFNRYTSCGCKAKHSAQQNLSTYHALGRQTKTNPGIIAREKANANNKTGIKGVCYTAGRYVAYITFRGQRYTLKRSTDINECIRARKEAEEKIFGDFLRWYTDLKNNKADCLCVPQEIENE